MKIRQARERHEDYEVYHELDTTSYINADKISIFVKIFSISYKDYCEMLRLEPKQHWILEDDFNNPVGYAKFDIYKDIAYIDDFFILKEYRRNYYGSNFFISIEKRVKSKGSKRIEIMVISKEAIKFWKKLGFKKEFGKYFYKDLD